MKKALSIALFLSVLLTAGCKGTNEQTSLPRGEVSPEWVDTMTSKLVESGPFLAFSESDLIWKHFAHLF